MSLFFARISGVIAVLIAVGPLASPRSLAAASASPQQNESRTPSQADVEAQLARMLEELKKENARRNGIAEPPPPPPPLFVPTPALTSPPTTSVHLTLPAAPPSAASAPAAPQASAAPPTPHASDATPVVAPALTVAASPVASLPVAPPPAAPQPVAPPRTSVVPPPVEPPGSVTRAPAVASAPASVKPAAPTPTPAPPAVASAPPVTSVPAPAVSAPVAPAPAAAAPVSAPAPAPAVRAPLPDVEGFVAADVQTFLGAPSTVQRSPQGTLIWHYLTPGGRQFVYFVDGVATMSLPTAAGAAPTRRSPGINGECEGLAAVSGLKALAIAKPDSPVFIEPRFRTQPLTLLPVNKAAEVVSSEGAWYLIRFNDERWGRRLGYIHCSDVVRQDK